MNSKTIEGLNKEYDLKLELRKLELLIMELK